MKLVYIIREKSRELADAFVGVLGTIPPPAGRNCVGVLTVRQA
ncbi:hypothetical protein [Desulfosporosinus fructosivorans]